MGRILYIIGNAYELTNELLDSYSGFRKPLLDKVKLT